MSKRKGIIVGVIVAVLLIGTFGTAYALFSNSTIGKNSELVMGDIYMHYKNSQEISLENIMPSETYNASKYFEFTIDGKNTSENDIWYEIVLTHGEIPEDKKTNGERIRDDLLKFTLIETKNGVNETVVNAKSYSNLKDGAKIWVGKIPAETLTDTTITYKLYMWISDKTKIGNTFEAVYDMDTWNNKIYSSIKVKVMGDFKKKELPKDATVQLIEKAGKKEEGIYGVDPEAGTICDNNCKEYRYTGSTVKNYVKLKNKQTSNGADVEELWRIIGVFTDENNGEKYIRIVRDEVLPEAILPSTYVKMEQCYSIKGSGTNVYWNKGGIENNDWATTGLQYYLNGEKDESENKGYMSYLSEETKKLLQERTHYLGTSMWNTDTAVSGYQHERDVKSCVNNKGATNSRNDFPVSGCNVWDGNEAKWKGSISLLYPSDYGFSADKQYWTETEIYNYKGGAMNTSWMYMTMKDAQSQYSWMLSPSFNGSWIALSWATDGYIGFGDVNRGGSNGVRAVLCLKFDVKIKSGSGTQEDPYIFEV